ncbi:MAG: hypothetical protein WA184_09555 [Stellaceae bacterium]
MCIFFDRFDETAEILRCGYIIHRSRASGEDQTADRLGVDDPERTQRAIKGVYDRRLYYGNLVAGPHRATRTHREFRMLFQLARVGAVKPLTMPGSVQFVFDFIRELKFGRETPISSRPLDRTEK